METRDPQQLAELQATAWEKLLKLRVVLLTTRDSAGRLSVRPMTVQHSEGERRLFFFASHSSQLAEDILREPQVSVCCMDVADSFYLGLAGRARLVDDAARKRELWSFLNKAWFPGGPDDPELALVEFEVERAEIWNSDSSRMVQLLSMAAAALTGNRPENVGEHAVIR